MNEQQKARIEHAAIRCISALEECVMTPNKTDAALWRELATDASAEAFRIAQEALS